MDEKTEVYINDFQKNDLFWGYGIENECYLELVNQKMEKIHQTVLLYTFPKTNNHKKHISS